MKRLLERIRYASDNGEPVWERSFYPRTAGPYRAPWWTLYLGVDARSLSLGFEVYALEGGGKGVSLRLAVADFSLVRYPAMKD